MNASNPSSCSDLNLPLVAPRPVSMLDHLASLFRRRGLTALLLGAVAVGGCSVDAVPSEAVGTTASEAPAAPDEGSTTAETSSPATVHPAPTDQLVRGEVAYFASRSADDQRWSVEAYHLDDATLLFQATLAAGEPAVAFIDTLTGERGQASVNPVEGPTFVQFHHLAVALHHASEPAAADGLATAADPFASVVIHDANGCDVDIDPGLDASCSGAEFLAGRIAGRCCDFHDMCMRTAADGGPPLGDDSGWSEAATWLAAHPGSIDEATVDAALAAGLTGAAVCDIMGAACMEAVRTGNVVAASNYGATTHSPAGCCSEAGDHACGEPRPGDGGLPLAQMHTIFDPPPGSAPECTQCLDDVFATIPGILQGDFRCKGALAIAGAVCAYPATALGCPLAKGAARIACVESDVGTASAISAVIPCFLDCEPPFDPGLRLCDSPGSGQDIFPACATCRKCVPTTLAPHFGTCQPDPQQTGNCLCPDAEFVFENYPDCENYCGVVSGGTPGTQGNTGSCIDVTPPGALQECWGCHYDEEECVNSSTFCTEQCRTEIAMTRPVGGVAHCEQRPPYNDVSGDPVLGMPDECWECKDIGDAGSQTCALRTPEAGKEPGDSCGPAGSGRQVDDECRCACVGGATDGMSPGDPCGGGGSVVADCSCQPDVPPPPPGGCATGTFLGFEACLDSGCLPSECDPVGVFDCFYCANSCSEFDDLPACEASGCLNCESTEGSCYHCADEDVQYPCEPGETLNLQNCVASCVSDGNGGWDWSPPVCPPSQCGECTYAGWNNNNNLDGGDNNWCPNPGDGLDPTGQYAVRSCKACPGTPGMTLPGDPGIWGEFKCMTESEVMEMLGIGEGPEFFGQGCSQDAYFYQYPFYDVPTGDCYTTNQGDTLIDVCPPVFRPQDFGSPWCFGPSAGSF